MGKDTYGMTETGKYGYSDCTFMWPDPHFFAALEKGEGCHSDSNGTVIEDSKKRRRRMLDCQLPEGRCYAIDEGHCDHIK